MQTESDRDDLDPQTSGSRCAKIGLGAFSDAPQRCRTPLGPVQLLQTIPRSVLRVWCPRKLYWPADMMPDRRCQASPLAAFALPQQLHTLLPKGGRFRPTIAGPRACVTNPSTAQPVGWLVRARSWEGVTVLCNSLGADGTLGRSRISTLNQLSSSPVWRQLSRYSRDCLSQWSSPLF